MKRSIGLAAMIIAGVLHGRIAMAFVSGTVHGRVIFYQNQGNYCPTSRNCTGAKYLQSEYQQYQGVRNSIVSIVDGTGTSIGIGSTDSNGYYTAIWTGSVTPPTAYIHFLTQDSSSRFKVVPSGTSAPYFSTTGAITLVANSGGAGTQELGNFGIGNSGAPNAAFNAFDGASRMWYSGLSASSLMSTNFYGLTIHAFSDTVPQSCPTSCASGNVVQLDSNAAFAPQGRVMHEMGHVARYWSRDWAWVSNYCYPATTTGCSWSLNTPEWGADSFEEGIATFFGDSALYAANAVAPHTCLSASACGTNAFNEETSSGSSSCATNEGRQPLSTIRYLWDDYDTVNEGIDNISVAYGTFFDTLHYYPTGYGNNQHNEPFSSVGVIDDLDGRSSFDFGDNLYFSTGTNDVSPWVLNCSP